MVLAMKRTILKISAFVDLVKSYFAGVLIFITF